MFRNRRNNVLWFDSRRLFSAKKIVLTQKKWRINGMKKVGIFISFIIKGCSLHVNITYALQNADN